MRAGFAQFSVAFGDFDHNAARVTELVARALPCDLLVLPELCFSGYDFADPKETAQFAEPFGDGAAAALLRQLAARHGITLVAGYAERAPEGCYNSALLVEPNGQLHNYRKLHLFNRERELFLPGDAPPPVIETPLGRIGMMICFDWFFPETARSLAARGAQLIAHPANLVLPWCQRAMPTRCLENRVYAITANRTGVESRAGRTLIFTGASQLLDTRGTVLASAPAEGEAVGAAEIDLAKADDKSIAGVNDLFRDRRPEMYAGL